MPRKKKDGRFINYYIDRHIFERLERYADDKGQQMTAALERILEEHLDRYEADLAAMQNYCPNCHVLVQGTRCPVDQAVCGLECHHPESLGRSKGVTVLLKSGEHIGSGFDVTVQPLNLQKIFVALCGEEAQ